MAEKKRKPESPVRHEPDEVPKKSYEPPKVVSHQAVEVVAAACTGGNAKTVPLEDGCVHSQS